MILLILGGALMYALAYSVGGLRAVALVLIANAMTLVVIDSLIDEGGDE